MYSSFVSVYVRICLFVLFCGLLIISCQTPPPDPQSNNSLLGGYIGTITLLRNSSTNTAPQLFDNFTVHVIKRNHPDSVMIDLLHRTDLFPNPLLATAQSNKLIVYPQKVLSTNRVLMGDATRTGDSLHMVLTESGSLRPITYQIRATRLLD